jgi:DNA-binding NarL/FixJ family response regulator
MNVANPLPPARILLVEDHPSTRAGLAATIATHPDLSVCAQTDSWHEALTRIRELHPDAVILDLQLKDGTGWSLLNTLSASGELPPTLVFSIFQEEAHAQRLLRAGARGYLSKDTPMEKVVVALRKILAGHLAVSDAIATQLISQAVGQDNKSPTEQETRELQVLSDRELQVLQMFSQDLGNKEIAARLNLSAKTVGTYKARLMEKLGVNTSPELQQIARQMLRNHVNSGTLPPA